MGAHDRPQIGPPTTDLRHRVALGVLALALLLLATGILAYFVRDDDEPSRPRTPTAAKAPPPGAPSQGAEPAPGPNDPPRTSDPVEYAKAFTARLWSYDSRTTSQTDHLASLQRWLTREQRYADPESIAVQVPDPLLWSRMRDGGQYAVATVAEGHIPASFTSALQADPGRITEAYAYAVTVSGKQQIAWNGSGAGAEARAVTLAVQCRPQQDCALVGVAPNVAP
jgi:hypothetical protein